MSAGDDWRQTFRPDIPSPARMYKYSCAAKTTLVKWYRDSCTADGLRPYRNVILVFRKLGSALCVACLVRIWGLCPIFGAEFPDSGLTPLTGPPCLAWGFAGSGLALARAGACRDGAWLPVRHRGLAPGALAPGGRPQMVTSPGVPGGRASAQRVTTPRAGLAVR